MFTHLTLFTFLQITGSRKAKAAAREDNDSEEESSEDEDYETEDEDDIELDEAFDDEEEIAEEEEEAMPPKRAAAKKAEAKINDVTRSMSTMSVSRSESFKAWSMDFSFPFMIKKFLHDGRESCSVDLILPPIHEDRIHPRVVSNGTYLAIGVAVPEFFGEEERVLVSAGNADVNTNQAAAHSEIVQDIRKHYNDVVEILGKPQMIKLPFQCEEQIAQWESQLFHGDELVTAALGEQQYYAVLSVYLFSVKRPTGRRNRGTMRVVGSPVLRDHRPRQEISGTEATAEDTNMDGNGLN